MMSANCPSGDPMKEKRKDKSGYTEQKRRSKPVGRLHCVAEFNGASVPHPTQFGIRVAQTNRFAARCKGPGESDYH
jgi:hypothetical protein